MYSLPIFFDTNFRYCDRIEVTETFAKAIKGKELSEFRKPIFKDSVWLMQKLKKSTEFDFYEEQKPAPNNYTGKVYILINGLCASSCADIAAILSYNKKAVFIGEETGGGFQGNTSGIVAVATIKPGNFILALPFQKYFNAVDPTLNVGHGTLPDYPVELTPEDLIKGNDIAMKKVLELIKNNRNQD